MVRIEEGWKNALNEEFEKPYFKDLTEKVRGEYSRKDLRIFPPGNKIFAAFDTCPFEDTTL